jgi:hypothetical protein
MDNRFTAFVALFAAAYSTASLACDPNEECKRCLVSTFGKCIKEGNDPVCELRKKACQIAPPIVDTPGSPFGPGGPLQQGGPLVEQFGNNTLTTIQQAGAGTVRTLQKAGGDAITTIQKAGDDSIKTTYKAAGDAIATYVKAWRDTGEQAKRSFNDAVDAGQAVSHYVENQAKAEIDAVNNALKRLRDGKVVDAWWGLATEPVKSSEENFAKATQESEVINAAAGSAARRRKIRLTVAGSPG